MPNVSGTKTTVVEVFDSPSGKGMCAACTEDVGPCEGYPCVNAPPSRSPSWSLDDQFVEDVLVELQRARRKFPSSILVLAALMEEVGELSQAMLKRRAGKDTDAHVRQEAVQVAAMALRCAVDGDPSFDAVPYTEP